MATINVNVDFSDNSPVILSNEFNQFDFGSDILRFKFYNGSSSFNPTTNFNRCSIRIERSDGKINDVMVCESLSDFKVSSSVYYVDHPIDPFDTFVAGSISFVISLMNVNNSGHVISRDSSRKLIFNVLPSISSYNAVDKNSIDFFVYLLNAVKALQATVNYQEYIDKLYSAVQSREGYDLSQNDFTNALKEKLESIENGAQKNVCPDWNEDDSSKDSYILNKPVLSKVASSGNYEDLKNKPEILGEYNPQSDMAMSGKAVAQAIAALIDSAPGALDTLKEISDALNNDPDFGNVVMSELLKKADISSLSKVATSGSFEDLEGKPQLSKVALSGNYADLSGKPITIISDINFKGTDEELNKLSARGLYYFPGSSTTDTLFIVVSNFDGWDYTDDGVNYKFEQWTQVIIGNQGIRKRQKTNYRNFSDGTPDYTVDWQDVSINNDLATKEDIASAIADLVDNSPETLNTLNEIAKALNYDPDFATTIINMLNEKANISDLARVATSGNYNDLIYKPKIKEINFDDIDTVWDYGVYFVDGRDYRYDDDKAEVLIVSTALRGTGQFYFYDDGRIGYRQGQDYHWNTDFKEIISAQNPPATTSYVDSAIGDALEEVY